MAGKPYHDQFKSQHVGPGFNIKVRRTSRTMRGGQGGPLPRSRICPADRLRPDGALPAFPPSPWVLCSLPCLQRTPVSADGSRVRGRAVTHAFPSRPLSPRPQRHTPRPFQTDFLFPHPPGTEPEGESRGPRRRILGILVQAPGTRGADFLFSPRFRSARKRWTGRPHPTPPRLLRGSPPPTCSRGVSPTCSGGAASAPRPGSVSPRGDTLCCSVSVLCDFGLRRSF